MAPTSIRNAILGVEASAWLARVRVHDPDIGVEVRVWPVRVLAIDRGWGDPLGVARETGDDAWAESRGRYGPARPSPLVLLPVSRQSSNVL
jgi:hypothetical protein